ncbi:MAG: hypothetical protein J0H91_05150, partial [Rhodospirillales bacterium]|nr:hypothetical protein [Rhodospirillales bacterium]
AHQPVGGGHVAAGGGAVGAQGVPGGQPLARAPGRLPRRGARAGQRPEAAEQQGAPAPCSALFQPGQLSSSLSQ